jgi:hypothetical protein
MLAQAVTICIIAVMEFKPGYCGFVQSVKNNLVLAEAADNPQRVRAHRITHLPGAVIDALDDWQGHIGLGKANPEDQPSSSAEDIRHSSEAFRAQSLEHRRDISL